MTSSNSAREPAHRTAGGGLSAYSAPLDPVRVRLEIAYDGTDFSGWAMQPDRRTVCGELTDALAMILRTPVRLTVAGRTDAGVHATGQVAHVDLERAVWEQHRERLVRRLAGVLDPDVRVLAVSEAPADFDARFSGLSRSYEYRISDQPWGVDPLRRRDVIAWPRPLDTARMQAAADDLLGLHDFAAYCRRRPDASTIRTLLRCDWGRGADGLVVGSVTADAFCHSMVRSLVGGLLAVGDGSAPVDLPRELLRESERSSRITVAPAKGLTLVGVDYPPDEQLAARNEITRGRRDLEHRDGPASGADSSATPS
ncbi:tRNA pseudouridine(38-40) synthase TruA [Epidermidibacterium keratini]|uniref:tRNA pseudouridine synthase A n=1 Tax=Epidermidibacterium keratini TaxID=1891644 RepID=A0A7L4YQ55_9ACTN|nr:tRNA pseudouridine(38-40) synthase TruA [Epidermidibacterium keratini]QHC01405.1 tRNA pseudouridine(38-40) synthase TruA [Epidermidibacterium keratini]